MDDVLLFLAGLLLCNAIPHLAAGLRGEPFPTPFARPRGVGLSAPLVNFAWGAANLVVGLGLGARHLEWGFNPGVGAGTLGFVLAGLYLSHHFGQVRAAGFRKP